MRGVIAGNPTGRHKAEENAQRDMQERGRRLREMQARKEASALSIARELGILVEIKEE